jgi:hypothetical protein
MIHLDGRDATLDQGFAGGRDPVVSRQALGGW